MWLVAALGCTTALVHTSSPYPCRALRASTPTSLDKLWSVGKKVADDHPRYANMVRGGKCAEVVMMFEHHLPESARDEFKSTGLAIPLLAEEKYAPHPGETDEEVLEAYDTYTADSSCYSCHVQEANVGQT